MKVTRALGMWETQEWLQWKLAACFPGWPEAQSWSLSPEATQHTRYLAVGPGAQGWHAAGPDAGN